MAITRKDITSNFEGEHCENTDCQGHYKFVYRVEMNKDFAETAGEPETVWWCEDCIDRDWDMIAE